MKRVVCLGSPHGRDRLGWDVAAALERAIDSRGIADVAVDTCATPAHLPALAAGAEVLVIVDALADVPAGSVRVLAPTELHTAPACSSHGIDLVTALKLAEALGELPLRTHILGIGMGAADAGSDGDTARLAEAVLPEIEGVLAALFALP